MVIDKEMYVKKHFDMVYKLAFSIMKDKHLAEDLTQDVFLKFLEEKKEFLSDEHIKAWLIRVTINKGKNVFNLSFYKKSVPLTEDIPFEEAQSIDLLSHVMKLPIKLKTALHLYYYEDMSISEIACAMNSKESTVKSWLKRGREKLKESLGGADIEF